MTKYLPYEEVTWYGADGHQYQNTADKNGNLYTFNASHTSECQCHTNVEWYEDGIL